VTEAPGALRRLGLLARTAPDYLLTAFWGTVGSRVGPPVEIVQAVVVHEGAVLLALRRDLRGWELPGGNVIPGEQQEDALRREVWEETGIEIALEGLVAVYRRVGFLPHRALVWRCRATGGALRPSEETPRVRWWPTGALPPASSPGAASRSPTRSPGSRATRCSSAASARACAPSSAPRASTSRRGCAASSPRHAAARRVAPDTRLRGE